MGKTKNRTHSELEHLRGQLKELRAENKSLKRRLRELEKHEHMYETTEEIEEHQEEIKKIKCPECFKGHLDEIEILNKVFGTCNVCGHRKKLRG